jgi:uncharacterized protein (DUF58 family)
MIEVLDYRLPWQTQSVYPGGHRGQINGSGQLFKRHQSLIDNPDPRRIDIRATLLDPIGNFRVRVYQQHSVVNVYLVADLSASMAYGNKQNAIIKFLICLANSVFTFGDKFAFIGCNDQINHDWLLPPGKHRGSITVLAEKLKRARFKGNANGMLQTMRYMSTTRSVVFLLTDCHFPIAQLSELLKSLMIHDVIPLVLWDQSETNNLPEWGLVSYQDMENHATRTLFMRPALRKKIIDAFQRRQEELKKCFRAFGCEPIFISDEFSIESLNYYLQQRTT